jgi:hypothetical protein
MCILQIWRQQSKQCEGREAGVGVEDPALAEDSFSTLPFSCLPASLPPSLLLHLRFPSSPRPSRPRTPRHATPHSHLWIPLPSPSPITRRRRRRLAPATHPASHFDPAPIPCPRPDSDSSLYRARGWEDSDGSWRGPLAPPRVIYPLAGSLPACPSGGSRRSWCLTYPSPSHLRRALSRTPSTLDLLLPSLPRHPIRSRSLRPPARLLRLSSAMFSHGADSAHDAGAVGVSSGGATVPTRFVWPYGGKRVFVSGSFTRLS